MAARRFQTTWDEIGFLDADFIASWGAFDGHDGPIKFEGIKPAQVRISHDIGADILSASYKWPDSPRREAVRSDVEIERRPCRFGGTRAYFICPRCRRSTLRLAVLPQGLRCGTCGRITWASRRETPTQRLVRKANRIAARLGLEHFSDRPKRPKYMRMVAYLKLCRELTEIVSQIDRCIGARLEGADQPLSALRTLLRLGI